MRIGIFFGGPSREREVSFAGGRTVYDNLDKSLFQPVPFFIDSHLNIIQVDWSFVYKGTIRDFYPPVEFLPSSNKDFQYYIECLGNLDQNAIDDITGSIGKKVNWETIQKEIDFAFLALHGEYGEDGKIQGILESLKIPYSGSGIRPCSIGMDKGFQKKLMEADGFLCPKMVSITKDQWSDQSSQSSIIENAIQFIGSPLVVRPANQGSSIGVSIIKGQSDLVSSAINAAFFCRIITKETWKNMDETNQLAYLIDLIDLRSGVGLPLTWNKSTFYDPNELRKAIVQYFNQNESPILLEGHFSEQEVIIESFIDGREFSCVVIQSEDGTPVALPPTEIVKGGEVFDYRSKYLAGLSRKITPINLPDDSINAIRKECERLYKYLGFNVYARIDGFITADGKIMLNDPNTTSGMLPSSFFFHQAAEIGLNPSQFLTYIVYTSLQERIRNTSIQVEQYHDLLNRLERSLSQRKNSVDNRKKIAVLMGGYSFERHIAVESGRNIYEKLSSSDKYQPIPVFLTHKDQGHTLYKIPINLLLKDNADDIRDKILHFKVHPVIQEIKNICLPITEKFSDSQLVSEPKELTYDDLSKLVDGVFIAIHGRPGEDGQVQALLDSVGLPYNGSSSDSSKITIDKYQTLQILKNHGFIVTNQLLVTKEQYDLDHSKTLQMIEGQFTYPFILKPVDDGCSSAVKIIRNPLQLSAFLQLLFRSNDENQLNERQLLGLKEKEEFPAKNQVLVESLITANGAEKFLEITGGFLTHREGQEIRYEMFEPSEALASGEVLSLEEKFLAGEGQNLTPPRFATDMYDYNYVAQKVKSDLQKAAQILGVQGYARIDAFVRIYKNGTVETIIIEVNSLPGMTPATCIFHQCAINGYKPYNFIDKILEFGFNGK